MGKMIQWATGTKPQRFDRTGCMVYPEFDMEKVLAEHNKLKEQRAKFDFKEGDWVWCSGTGKVEQVTSVDPDIGSVYLGIYPHAPEDLKKLPDWFTNALKEAIKECSRVKTTHRVEIVPVDLRPHPNADTLSVVQVFGFTVVVKTEDWKDKTIGAYIPPDSICPDLPEYEWLGDKRRIRARKIRGVVSMGLLAPAPEGSKLGDEVSSELGITHYEPHSEGMKGKHGNKDPEGGPQTYAPHYDVSNARRYLRLFTPGEEVVATEKVHGANARYVYLNGRYWCGSRNQWKAESQSCLWWQALAASTALQEFLKDNPGCIVYGEVYGDVQDLRYDCLKGEVKFVAFDIMLGSNWISHDLAREIAPELPWVPEVYRGPFDWDKLCQLAEGDTVLGGGRHCMEGLVIKPINERDTLEVGRLQLKLISNRYLEK
jgi:RNA ligase (TIGR02306 family)